MLLPARGHIIPKFHMLLRIFYRMGPGRRRGKTANALQIAMPIHALKENLGGHQLPEQEVSQEKTDNQHEPASGKYLCSHTIPPLELEIQKI